MSNQPLTLLDGSPLTTEQVARVARNLAPVTLARDARNRMDACRGSLLATIASGDAHYGINTGFGSLARTRIDDASLGELQRNLVRSHAAGIGEPLSVEVVRAMMVVLAASLSRGLSAVRPEVVDLILALLNHRITPMVPETGSVGASGDLAPLAHVALALIGEGEVLVDIGSGRCETCPASTALGRAGLSPVVLEAKEGLALINGTHLMAGRGALLVDDFDRCAGAAFVAAAMSMDACRVTHRFLDARVHAARNQPGCAHVAQQLRDLLHGSEIAQSHAVNDPRVQDPYSFRCAPAVLGASQQLAQHVRTAVEHELGAVTDNPLVFATDANQADIVSAGNFHGMPVALPLDCLALAACHVAGLAERRVFHMLSVFDPESGLKPFLSPTPGLHSGYMIVQYAAAAACNEMIGLCTPASVSNLATCAEMEDYNSFGPRSAAKAGRALDLLTSVIAAELLCAAQGLEAHRPLRSGQGVERAHTLIRERVPRLIADRPPYADVRAIESMVRDGTLAAVYT
ncbi:MAG: histidine ammonia-lyase [Phycisphaeraceae bacterium]|nr:histidine ammonia-lyase [Phycisphaeraceae bacterium]MCW5764205.1 histidine ammonia-lyase [Phycisphaeraceae bacterium]